MNGDFLEALQAMAKEKEIPLDQLLENVEGALATAYKKTLAALGEIKVRLNTSTGTFQIFALKTVIEEGEPEQNEILLDEAREIDPSVVAGEQLEIEVKHNSMGRIDAQTAKQVLVQKIREAERDRIYEEYNERIGEVITGTVQRREFKNIFINLGKIEALLPPQEQVETEPYRFNDRLKLYMLEVRKTPKGPQVIVSRTHPSLIRRLFELEVPEIADGIVSIKSVAREPGARSKIAVYSRDEKVDPVGSCVGHRGSRVQAVVNELYDEKIDIVRWSAETYQFIAEALSPAKAVKVTVNEEAKSAFVVVPDNQLSLAIGKSGQNVRLAARLTGWRIDIRSESQVAKATLIAATTPDGEPLEEHDVIDTGRPSRSEAVEAVAAAPEEEEAAEPVVASAPVSQLSDDEADDSLPMIELPDIFPDFSDGEEEESSNGTGAHAGGKELPAG